MVAINIRPPLNNQDKKTLLAQCQRRKCSAKKPLLDNSTPADLLFYIVSGSIAITAISDSGKTINIVSLRSGDFFCQTDLSLSDNIESINIEASENCDIAAIGYQEFNKLAAENSRYRSLLSPTMAALIFHGSAASE